MQANVAAGPGKAGIEVDTRHWIGGRRAGALRQGDPRDDEIDIGPNITQAHVERIDGFVQRAIADGAERVSAQLTAGTVWVNCFFVRDLRAPFGGAGLSGIGREGGTWSFDFYCDVKNTVYSGTGWQGHGEQSHG